VQWRATLGDSGSIGGTPLRAIIAYKSIKAALQLTIALLLAIWWPLGLPEQLLHLAGWLRDHLTQGWAARLAEWIVAGSSGHRILWSIAALTVDGVLTAVEAWALHTGRTWGAWLVVGATALLLPVEVYELVRVPHWSRALILVANLVIVGYVARCAWREHVRVA